MQDAEEYFPLRFRSALVPVVTLARTSMDSHHDRPGIARLPSWHGWGVLVFAAERFFALATLPVEFNASARAKQLLVQTGIIQSAEERRGVNSVLNAAALTYVAGFDHCILQLLYYVFLVGGRRRD